MTDLSEFRYFGQGAQRVAFQSFGRGGLPAAAASDVQSKVEAARDTVLSTFAGKFYLTLAEAQADIGNITEGAIIQILADEDQGGLSSYRQKEGTALTFLRTLPMDANAAAIANLNEVFEIKSVADLQNYTGPSPIQLPDGSVWDTDDTTDHLAAETDNEMTVVNPEGKAFKRVVEFSVKAWWFGVDNSGATETHTAIQRVFDLAWQLGGRKVEFQGGTHLLGATVFVWNNVIGVGQGNGYNHLYSSVDFEALGTVFKMKAGGNVDLVVGRYKPKAGEAAPTSPDHARHQGGLRDITLFGNRSASQARRTTDLNNAGVGGVIEGCSNFTWDNVLAIRCGDDGFVVRSYDYGAGLVPPNNNEWKGTQALGNAGYGYRCAGGDQQFGVMTAGYNGLGGVLDTSTTSQIIALFSWNNQGYGLERLSNDTGAGGNIFVYDNDLAGVYQGGIGDLLLTGLVTKRNGRDATAAAKLRAGIFRSADAGDLIVSGAIITDDGKYDGPSQQYGISDDATTPIRIGSVRLDGNVLAPLRGITMEEITTPEALRSRKVTLASVNTTAQNLTAIQPNVLYMLTCERPEAAGDIDQEVFMVMGSALGDALAVPFADFNTGTDRNFTITAVGNQLRVASSAAFANGVFYLSVIKVNA